MRPDVIDMLERLPGPWVDRGGLRVDWHRPWSAECADALRELPQTATCSHELLSALMRNAGPMPKRTALVTRDGRPVAVLGLRKRNHFWEPVWGGGVNERFTLAAAPGYAFPALAATGVNLWIISREAPQPGTIRSATPLPIFGIDTREDYEAHWRRSSHMDTVRKTRRKCAGFTLAVDEPGDDEWTIRCWAAKWRAHEAEGDLRLAAEYYRAKGLYHSFTLRAGGERVAGCTFIVHGSALLGQLNFYAPEFARLGVQTRLDDLVFEWARSSRTPWLDLGCSYREESYKRHWGPRDGTAWLINIAPAHLHLARVAVNGARRAIASAGSALRSAGGQAT